jgi:hypothetical protein
MRDARIPEAVVKAMCRLNATAAQWAVLVSLYVFAGPDGTCYPSVTTLEYLTRRNRRTVTRAIVWLVEAGVIVRTKSPGRANAYRLTTRGSYAPTEAAEVGAMPSPTRGNPVPQLGAATPPEQEELEQVSNSGDLFEDFWKGYPVQRGKERARAAFLALVANGEDPQDLVRAGLAYGDECRRYGREDRFIKRACNFLDPGERLFAEYAALYAPPPAECSTCGGLGIIDHPRDPNAALYCPECHPQKETAR